NNQIGFTTNPEDGRSGMYCTAVARMLQSPIFHVNGEDPEAVAQCVFLAMDFRKTFRRDVVIDMYCYRKYGHNEGDEPEYTHPLLYKQIKQHVPVRESYLKKVLSLGSVTREESEQIAIDRRDALERELKAAREHEVRPPSVLRGLWAGYQGGPDKDVPEVET